MSSSSLSTHLEGEEQNRRCRPRGDTKYVGLSKMFETGVFSDVVVHVDSGSKERIYKLHKAVLSQNSEYFRCMFTRNHFKEGAENVVRLPTKNAKAFRLVLGWLYEGRILDAEPGDNLNIGVYSVVFEYASYFQIPSLMRRIMDMIVQNINHYDSREAYAIGGEDDFLFDTAINNLIRLYSTEKDYFNDFIPAICKNNLGRRILAVPRLKELLLDEPDLLMRLYEAQLDECDKKHF